MVNQSFHTFPEIYKSWYLAKHPEAAATIHEGEDFPGLSDARREFEAFLNRLGAQGTLRQDCQFKFNEDGKELLLMFLSHSKDKKIKDIRRGKFTPENADLYDKILALIVSNMRALGHSQRTIDQQVIYFWDAVAGEADHPEDFLTGLKRLYTSDELHNLLSGYKKPMLFYENLYYINENAKESFAPFQEQWRQLIKLILDRRRIEMDVINAEYDILGDFDKAAFSDFLETFPEYPNVLDNGDTHLAANRKRLEGEREYTEKAADIFTEERIKEIAEEFRPIGAKLRRPSKPWELYTKAVRQLSKSYRLRKAGAHRIIKHNHKNRKVEKRGGNR